MHAVQVPHPSLPSPWAGGVDPWLTRLPAWTEDAAPPVMWAVAGTDSGGGAGLAADVRTAAAMGVHACTVVAAVTAQHSQGVQAVYPMDAAALRAQLAAVRADMPARVIKTGLLASAAAADVLLAQRGDALLVVDPVLGASAGGAAFCDEALLAAYRHQLLPQAALVTPNRREAERLLGLQPGQCSVPELARRLRRLGAQAVCITGGDDLALGAALALDWLDSPLATGWIALPRWAPPSGEPLHHHGSGCTFATAAAAALARGFALPDAVLLAKMLTWCALRDGHAAGHGAGPLRPSPGFVCEPAAMPVMSLPDEEDLSDERLRQWAHALECSPPSAGGHADFAPGLYAIADDAEGVRTLAASGHFAHVQLRIKRTSPVVASQALASAHHADHAAEDVALQAQIASAVAAVDPTGPTLWINDHWRQALQAGAAALHLGQEDWAALAAHERQALQARCQAGQLRLGLSSHSLWELCRARAVAPTYIACGPVWPTVTKDMPWWPQGLAQLSWWSRMAGRPVVAIGGILEEQQVEAAWQAGAAAVCLVRAARRWAARPQVGGERS